MGRAHLSGKQGFKYLARGRCVVQAGTVSTEYFPFRAQGQTDKKRCNFTCCPGNQPPDSGFQMKPLPSPTAETTEWSFPSQSFCATCASAALKRSLVPRNPVSTRARVFWMSSMLTSPAGGYRLLAFLAGLLPPRCWRHWQLLAPFFLVNVHRPGIS